MLYDNLTNYQRYKGMNLLIDKAFEFLSSSSIQNLPLGRHEIAGDKIFALVLEYDTHPLIDSGWEAHRKYYDIQYMLRGSERIALAHIDTMKIVEEYNSEGDYQLFSGQGDLLSLNENNFIVLNPYEVHQPGILLTDNSESLKVRKIVVKVLI